MLCNSCSFGDIISVLIEFTSSHCNMSIFNYFVGNLFIHIISQLYWIYIYIYIHKWVRMIIRIEWSYLKCRRYGSGKFHSVIFPEILIKTYQQYIQIYANVSNHTQNIQRYIKVYKIPSGGGATPPGPARPGRLWYIWIFLDISLVYALYVFNIFWYIPNWIFLERYGSISQWHGQTHSHLSDWTVCKGQICT